jgi:hypothetical protein
MDVRAHNTTSCRAIINQHLAVFRWGKGDELCTRFSLQLPAGTKSIIDPSLVFMIVGSHHIHLATDHCWLTRLGSAVRTTRTSGWLACVRRLEQPARVADLLARIRIDSIGTPFKTLAAVVLGYIHYQLIWLPCKPRELLSSHNHRIIITSHLAMQVHVHVHVHNGCAELRQVQDPLKGHRGDKPYRTSPTCRAYGGRSSLLPIQV